MVITGAGPERVVLRRRGWQERHVRPKGSQSSEPTPVLLHAFVLRSPIELRVRDMLNVFYVESLDQWTSRAHEKSTGRDPPAVVLQRRVWQNAMSDKRTTTKYIPPVRSLSYSTNL